MRHLVFHNDIDGGRIFNDGFESATLAPWDPAVGAPQEGEMKRVTGSKETV